MCLIFKRIHFGSNFGLLNQTWLLPTRMATDVSYAPKQVLAQLW
jgi:hypothetical protein